MARPMILELDSGRARPARRPVTDRASDWPRARRLSRRGTGRPGRPERGPQAAARPSPGWARDRDPGLGMIMTRPHPSHWQAMPVMMPRGPPAGHRDGGPHWDSPGLSREGQMTGSLAVWRHSNSDGAKTRTVSERSMVSQHSESGWARVIKNSHLKIQK